MTEDRVAHRRAYRREWMRKRRLGLIPRSVIIPQEPPPPEVLAERDRTLAQAPRSLVALIAGDPLPGRSALDRRS